MLYAFSIVDTVLNGGERKADSPLALRISGLRPDCKAGSQSAYGRHKLPVPGAKMQAHIAYVQIGPRACCFPLRF